MKVPLLLKVTFCPFPTAVNPVSSDQVVPPLSLRYALKPAYVKGDSRVSEKLNLFGATEECLD